MSIQLKTHERENVTILVAKGRITAQEAGAVREAITNLQDSGHIQIVLDLADIDYIDSTGLGALVICYTHLKKANGMLKLLHVNKRNVELLALTKLHTIFEVFAEEQDAVNSFFPGREIKRFDILNFVREHGDEKDDEAESTAGAKPAGNSSGNS